MCPFIIAISRTVVNHHGNGLILYFGPLVLFPRSVGWFMRFVTGPCCPDHVLSGILSPAVSADDIAHCLYTTGLLLEWVAFLGSLHWPAGGMDLGLVVFLMSSCSFFMSFGLERGLSLEKAHPRYLRPGRPSSVSAVPFGPGVVIWRSCRFIGALMGSLCLLLGGLGRFVPCSIGANHCRLRHIGWEKCGHGLSSRPRESASEVFLNELLLLFQYPPRFSRALFAGTLPLRYCAAQFASKVLTWRLLVSGHAASLVT